MQVQNIKIKQINVFPLYNSDLQITKKYIHVYVVCTRSGTIKYM